MLFSSYLYFQLVSGLSCSDLLLPSVSNVFYDIIYGVIHSTIPSINITGCQPAIAANVLLALKSEVEYEVSFSDLNNAPPISTLQLPLNNLSSPFSTALFNYATKVNSSSLVTISRSVLFGPAVITVTLYSPTTSPSRVTHASEIETSSDKRISVIAAAVVGSFIIVALIACFLLTVWRVYRISYTAIASTNFENEVVQSD